MKKILLIFLLVPLFTIGQPNLDSLWGVWQDESQKDTIRLGAIDQFIWKGYLFSQPDSAFHLAQLQYDFAEKKGIQQNMAGALNIQGISFAIKGDFDEAVNYYEKSLVIHEVNNNQRGIAGALNNIAGIYMSQGNMALAIDYNSRGLKLYDEIGDLGGSARCLSNIGRIYNNQEELLKSIEFYELSLKKFEENGDKKEMGGVYHNLGSIYKKQNLFEKALKHYTIALELHQELGNKLGIASDKASIGAVYLKKGEQLKALELFFNALGIAQKLGAKDKIGSYQNEIGNAYNQLGKQDSAISYSSDALKIAQSIGDSKLISDASLVLYRSNKLKGNNGDALEMFELHTQTKDSLQSEENQRAIIRYEYQTQFEKNLEREKGENQLKTERERYIILLSFILLVTLVGVYLKSRYTRNLKERTELLHQIELLKEKGTLNTITTDHEKEKLTLNRERIETAINGTINTTDWNILKAIFNNPIITNKAIAEEVSLSVEGVSSSLRRMYVKFNLEKSSNQKLALLMEATKICSISNENT